MKKLLSILTLLVVAVTGAWAQEAPTPDYESYDWENADAITAALGEHGDITISSVGLGSSGNVSGHWYINANQNLKNSDSSWKYFGISSTRQITKIEILYCPNGTNMTNVAWVAWGKNVEPNQYTLAHGETPGTTGSKSWDAKVWETIDLSGTEAYTVYMSRSIREFREIGGSSNLANFGKGQTINILGFRVYLKAAGPVDPSFSLTKTSIGTDETSQIKVEGKDNLDGITLSDITYGTSGVVTVNATTGVVTPVAVGTTTISFNSSAVAEKYNAGSGNLSITVTAPQVATPTLPATGTFVESKSVEISCATDGATIKYSYDNTNWTDYTTALNITETKTVYAKATKSGYTDSEVASATYTKVTPHTWAAISESTTWDWSTLTTTEVKLTDSTTPTKTEEFLLGDMNGEIYTYNIGYDPATFNADALKVVTEYAVRDKKYMQGNKIKFNTTVPGYVRVTYSNTGGDRPYRYVKVNDTFSQEGSASATAMTTEYIPVPAGEVTIVGYIQDANDPTPRSGDVVGEAMLRISKVEFLKQASTVVTSAEWATATTPNYAVEFGEGAKAYIATSSEGDKIKLTQITDAPAKTAIIVNAPAGSYTMTPKASASSDVTGNLLKSKTANDATAAVGDYALGTWIDGGNTVVGFGKLNAAGVANMTDDKAFIPASSLANTVDFLPFVIGDEENETTSIKAVETAEVSGTVYNLAGQKVGKDYKGIVIVNGKKFVRK